MAEGIRKREGKKGIGWQAWVYLPGGARRSKTFATEKEAKRWRTAQLNAAGSARVPAAARISVREAGTALIAAMRDGSARTRSGDAYKPSVIRGYEDDLRLHIYKPIGAAMLGDVDRQDVQRIADHLLAGGASASKIRNAIMPLRVIYRRAIRQGIVDVSPCSTLELPAVRSERAARIAAPDEAARLIAAVPAADRVLWATAFYAGLRRGELLGLERDDVDLAAHVIHVRRGWDAEDGEIDPKSRSGRRDVPIISILAPYLADQISTRARELVVFPSERGGRFNVGRVRLRALEAWRTTYECGCRWKKSVEEAKPPAVCAEHKRPGLTPIKLHDARHTFASTAIAAGCNVKELSVFMGHSSIIVTLDIYGHLFPGGEVDFRNRMDAYMAAAS
jgi:integrase